MLQLKLTSFGGAIVKRTVRSRSAVVAAVGRSSRASAATANAAASIHATSSRRLTRVAGAALDTAVAPELVNSEK